MFDFRRNLEHAERLAHNVAMADRWRQLASDETRVTRCAVCRDALTVDELRAGLSVCLCCLPDRLACPSCHEPTVDGRFCGVCVEGGADQFVIDVAEALAGSHADDCICDVCHAVACRKAGA